MAGGASFFVCGGRLLLVSGGSTGGMSSIFEVILGQLLESRAASPFTCLTFCFLVGGSVISEESDSGVPGFGFGPGAIAT